MTYVIAEPCINVKDRSCVPECPVTAIFPEEDRPPQWKTYIAKNRDAFQSASPPGKPQSGRGLNQNPGA